MKLKKRIISAIMAICVSMSILPTNMQLLAVEAKAEETTLVQEDNTTQIEDYYKYIPTGTANFSFYFDSPNISYNTKFDAIYLFDSQNEIVASTVDEIVFGSGGTLYCTRKLNADEKFHLGYKIEKNTYVLKNTIITATDKPYIRSINQENNIFYEDDGCIASVEAYNTDFTKLSFTLSNEDGKVIASSVSSTVMKTNYNTAYYYIKWQDREKPNNYNPYALYNVNYTYPNISDIPKLNRACSFVDRRYSYDIRWNYKTESVEWYDEDMLPNSKVDYYIYDSSDNSQISNSENLVTFGKAASGTAVTVNSDHVVKIDLKEMIKKDKKNIMIKTISILLFIMLMAAKKSIILVLEKYLQQGLYMNSAICQMIKNLNFLQEFFMVMNQIYQKHVWPILLLGMITHQKEQ